MAMMIRYLCQNCQQTVKPGRLLPSKRAHGTCSSCGCCGALVGAMDVEDPHSEVAACGRGDYLWLTDNLPPTSGSKTDEYGGEAVGLVPGIDY